MTEKGCCRPAATKIFLRSRTTASWLCRAPNNDRFSREYPLPLLHGQLDPAGKFDDNCASQEDPAEALALVQDLTRVRPNFDAACPVAGDESDFDLADTRAESYDLLHRRSLIVQEKC